MKLWNIATGVEEHSFNFPEGVMSVAISGDNTHIAAGGSYGHVRIWSRVTKLLVFTSKDIASELRHRDAVCSISLSYAGEDLLSASRDQTWKFWNGRGFTNVKTYKGHTVKSQPHVYHYLLIKLLKGSPVHYHAHAPV